MNASRLLLLSASAAAFALFACGSDHAPPIGSRPINGGAGGETADSGASSGGASPDGSLTETGGRGSAGHGGHGGQGGTSESDGGSAGTGNGPGDGGTALPDSGVGEDAGNIARTCGDGVRQPGEFCDGLELHDTSCESFGYTGGTLSCKSTCSFDFSGCTGTELCFDGIDNDGNHLRDCNDPACTAGCADSCASATLLLDPGLVNGDTSGHANTVASSCIPPNATSGPDIVFRFVASMTGALKAVLSSTAPDLSLSVRSTCGDATTELACRDSNAGPGATETVRLPVTAGDVVYLVVDGADDGQAGIWNLEASTHAIVCGDSQRDPGEDCDDGNTEPKDGCSSTCKLESDEVEPNETIATADKYTGWPFIGSISSASDVDVHSIQVTAPNSMISIDTYDLGDGACLALDLDDRVELLSSDGKVLGQNDDGGDGFCASLTVASLSAGTYYVRVRASGTATSFPYVLDVNKSP